MNSQEHAFRRVGLVLPRVLDHAVHVRPCACGGQVRADVRFPTEGVRRHNGTKRHKTWRAAMGYDW